ncbi:MAG: LPS export ABC transporter ATP-binding protein [Myxococcales bacterium]|nr:MAG: LPS export ABC transporter ATP-binding protein [Myxococcales bacterium]
MDRSQDAYSGGASVLAAENLRFRYGRREVLAGVSLSAAQGRIVGLLGPNGAGKTTCLNLIAGLLPLQEGRITLNGRNVSDVPLHRRARLGLGYLPQESSVFRGLTTRQNLELVLEERGAKKTERGLWIDELLERFGLSALSGAKASTLSGGERRRLEIARALALRPTLLVFDEPFAGIDPVTVQSLRHLLRGLAESGVAILLADHNIPETLKICDRATILADGAVLMEGTPEAVVADPRARAKFLGDEFKFDA